MVRSVILLSLFPKGQQGCAVAISGCEFVRYPEPLWILLLRGVAGDLEAMYVNIRSFPSTKGEQSNQTRWEKTLVSPTWPFLDLTGEVQRSPVLCFS